MKTSSGGRPITRGLTGAIQVRLRSPRSEDSALQNWSLPSYFIAITSPSVHMGAAVLINRRVAGPLGIREGDEIEMEMVEAGVSFTTPPVIVKDRLAADVIINGAIDFGLVTGFDSYKRVEKLRFSNGKELVNPIQYLWAGMRQIPPPFGSIAVYFDGGSRNNPEGPAGYGYIIKNVHNESLIRGYGYYPQGTSNEMEYQGLLEALIWAVRLETKRMVIRGDSELVIRQCTGEYKVNDDQLRPLNRKCKDLLSKARKFGTNVALEHIPRANNSMADFLCNLGIDSRSHATICDWSKMEELKMQH